MKDMRKAGFEDMVLNSLDDKGKGLGADRTGLNRE